jgi:membrane protein involved in colicin uptake
MPIDLSNLSAEDVTAATTAIEAARRAREERECLAAEERRKRQEEEQARQEATMWREAEERKEAAARKAEAERRDHLAREKAAQEAAAAEEQRQSLATGLLGLKLTIPAPASIARTTSGSSTQSKGEEEGDRGGAIQVSVRLIIHVSFTVDFFCRSRFPFCDLCTIAGVPCLMELRKNGTQ